MNKKQFFNKLTLLWSKYDNSDHYIDGEKIYNDDAFGKELAVLCKQYFGGIE